MVNISSVNIGGLVFDAGELTLDVVEVKDSEGNLVKDANGRQMFELQLNEDKTIYNETYQMINNKTNLKYG